MERRLVYGEGDSSRDGNMHFFLLSLLFVKLVLLITFFGAYFYNFFNGFKISVKFCVFLYLF